MVTGREYLTSILESIEKIKDWDDAKLDQYAVDLEEVDAQIGTVADDDAIVLAEEEVPAGVLTINVEDLPDDDQGRARQRVTVGAGVPDQDISEEDLGPVINPGGEM